MISVDAILNSIVEEPTDVWVQFNKISGEYTGVFQHVDLSVLNQEYYNYVKVTMNPATQRIKGTFSNFQIVDISAEPMPVYESAMNNAAQAKIDMQYSIYARLEMIDRVLGVLLEKNGITDVAFSEMRSFIDENFRVNNLMKESYKNDPNYNYISIEQEKLTNEAQMEGGLHEFFGPREAAPQVNVNV